MVIVAASAKMTLWVSCKGSSDVYVVGQRSYNNSNKDKSLGWLILLIYKTEVGILIITFELFYNAYKVSLGT
jgi:hypothetical protein